jgi:hypothetical protein
VFAQLGEPIVYAFAIVRIVVDVGPEDTVALHLFALDLQVDLKVGCRD